MNVEDRPAVAKETTGPIASQDPVDPGYARTFKLDVTTHASTKNADGGMTENEDAPASFHAKVSPDDKEPAKCE